MKIFSTSPKFNIIDKAKDLDENYLKNLKLFFETDRKFNKEIILNNGIDDALKRAINYSKAGADLIMIHSKKKKPN